MATRPYYGMSRLVKLTFLEFSVDCQTSRSDGFATQEILTQMGEHSSHSTKLKSWIAFLLERMHTFCQFSSSIPCQILVMNSTRRNSLRYSNLAIGNYLSLTKLLFAGPGNLGMYASPHSLPDSPGQIVWRLKLLLRMPTSMVKASVRNRNRSGWLPLL